MNAATPPIKFLFEPRGVAVIGASSNPGKIGHTLVRNILNSGYKGRVYPINPGGGEVLGLPVYKRITDVGDEVDVACIAIPAKYVFEAVKDCARQGVKFLPIITSGFSEVGNAEVEREIVAHAQAHGMRVLGPNIFGLYSVQASIDATFGSGNIRPGNVAIITQSGALGVAMIGRTAIENIGLSAMISVGNKADIDEADLLQYLTYHERTKVVLMYVEGVKDGEKLISALKAATRHKPVVVIKSGRSKRGAVAAASHTGSLAGADEIFDDIMRQCGVMRAESLDEAFSWCKFLADAPSPAGLNTVIVTNGGGVGVMATDACEKYGIGLYDNQATLKEIFDSATPDFGSTKNPVDITGQASSQDYHAALGAALETDEVNAVIALYCETAMFDADNLTSMIETNHSQYQAVGKPVVFSILGGQTVEQSLNTLRKKRVPVYGDVYEAVSCLGAGYTFRTHRLNQADHIEAVIIDTTAIDAIVDGALDDGRSFLLAHEALQVMEAAGVPMPQSAVCRSLEAAVERAAAIGYPVVMKVVSKDILHKSDAGGVALDLENAEEVIDAYQAIMHSSRAYNPEAVIEGVEVSEMVRPGVEVIIGARRDRTFGPIVMFGLGGIYVEVMKDVAFRALPLNRQTVLGMMEQIRSYPLLLGVRGEAQKDIERAVDTILKLAAIIQTCRGITDIEINPLMVYDQGQGVKAVDARILVANTERGN